MKVDRQRAIHSLRLTASHLFVPQLFELDRKSSNLFS